MKIFLLIVMISSASCLLGMHRIRLVRLDPWAPEKQKTKKQQDAELLLISRIMDLQTNRCPEVLKQLVATRIWREWVRNVQLVWQQHWTRIDKCMWRDRRLILHTDAKLQRFPLLEHLRDKFESKPDVLKCLGDISLRQVAFLELLARDIDFTRPANEVPPIYPIYKELDFPSLKTCGKRHKFVMDPAMKSTLESFHPEVRKFLRPVIKEDSC